MKSVTTMVAAMVLLIGALEARAQPIGSRGVTTSVYIGMVKALSPSTVTVLAGAKTTVFALDAKSRIRIGATPPKTVPSIPDLLHVGDQVSVKARDVKGTMLLTDIAVQVVAPSAAKPGKK